MGNTRVITGLVVPADPERPVAVVEVSDHARSFSDAIGGGLLDDTVTAALVSGDRIALYLDEQRHQRRLPVNLRARRLLARLAATGQLGEVPDAEPRGDLLITGLERTGADTHVPPAVLAAAVAAGLLDPAGAPPLALPPSRRTGRAGVTPA